MQQLFSFYHPFIFLCLYVNFTACFALSYCIFRNTRTCGARPGGRPPPRPRGGGGGGLAGVCGGVGGGFGQPAGWAGRSPALLILERPHAGGRSAFVSHREIYFVETYLKLRLNSKLCNRQKTSNVFRIYHIILQF